MLISQGCSHRYWCFSVRSLLQHYSLRAPAHISMKAATDSALAQCRTSGRVILLSFLVLVLIVIIQLMSSTTRLSVIYDMSQKMRSDVGNVISDVIKDGGQVIANFNLKTFKTKEEMDIDYNKWAKVHALLRASETLTNKKNNTNNYESTSNTSVEATGELEDTLRSVASIPTQPKVRLTILGNPVSSGLKTRRERCDSCYEHNFKYIIQNETICNVTNGQVVDLIIFILTTHQNYKSRMAVRQTWLQITKQNTQNIRYAFLLGETTNENLRRAVTDEAALYHDILKEDFVDSYKNLTYKTIMAFKWASLYCGHARYVMKTDDDMYVHVPNVLKALDNPKGADIKSTVIGSCTNSAKPIRNIRSKWFASNDSYPENHYPGFCSGTGYATSLKVVRDIYEISPYVPFFHLEDVYVSLCIKRLNYTLQPIPGFNAGRPKLDPCLYKGDKLITAHQLTPTMLSLMWKKECTNTVVKLNEKSREKPKETPKEKQQ